MQSLIRAFQLHFRPARPDGRLDASTLDTLARLVAATQKAPNRLVNKYNFARRSNHVLALVG